MSEPGRLRVVGRTIMVGCYCCDREMAISETNLRRCIVVMRQHWPKARTLAFEVHDLPEGVDYTERVSHSQILALVHQAAKVYRR